MEQTLQPVHAKDRDSYAIRGSRQNYAARRAGQNEGAPTERKPSYLDTLREELLQFVHANHVPELDQAKEIVNDSLWPWVAKRLAASYWNGVRDGASGRVKPRTESR